MDAHWQSIADQHAVRYNALPPGKYTFKVRVSHDDRHWQPAENEVHIQIATPYYRQTWFVIVSIVLLGLLTWMLLRNARKKQSEQREQLETEVVIHYFASQINRHKDENEMLWDVAKNCISKLNLEECVIYMLDTSRNVLVQKAAYGPKNPKDQTILQPIEIQVGQGITGTVALTQKG